jgi:calcineurin-like phosphoesterase
MPEITVETKFYTFAQNNSGGSFIINDKVAEYVIIEATNASHANQIAEDMGIYFNGCDNGIDCECCGDRWYATSEYDAQESPMLYAEPIENRIELTSNQGKEVYCYVYYMNGSVKKYA